MTAETNDPFKLLQTRILQDTAILNAMRNLESIAADSTFYAYAGLLGYDGYAPFSGKLELLELRRSYQLVISDGSDGPQVMASGDYGKSFTPVKTWQEAWGVIHGFNEEQSDDR